MKIKSTFLVLFAVLTAFSLIAMGCVVEPPPPPSNTYGISLSGFTGDTYSFAPSLAKTFTAPSALTVTVTNTGNQATGELTITLLDDDDVFEVSKTTITNIAAGETETFTVSVSDTVTEGSYLGMILVEGDNDIEEDFFVDFHYYVAVIDDLEIDLAGTKVTASVFAFNNKVDAVTDGYSSARVEDYGFDSSYSWIMVDFGTRKLSDFGALQFTYNKIGTVTQPSQSDTRRPSLVASKTLFPGKTPSGSLTRIEPTPTGFSNYFMEGQVSNASNSATPVNNSTVNIALLPNLTSAFNDTSFLFLSIYERNGWGDTPDGAGFSATNITFIEACSDCGYYPCRCCPVCGAYPCECVSLIDFSAWHAQYYNVITNNKLTDSLTATPPLSVAGTDTNVIATLESDGSLKIQLLASSSSRGVLIDIGENGLGLDTANNDYEITITGTYYHTGGSGGTSNNVVLARGVATAGTAGTNLVTQSMPSTGVSVDNPATGALSLTYIIAEDFGTDYLRIRGGSSDRGTTIYITDIEIKDRGPRP